MPRVVEQELDVIGAAQRVGVDALLGNAAIERLIADGVAAHHHLLTFLYFVNLALRHTNLHLDAVDMHQLGDHLAGRHILPHLDLFARYVARIRRGETCVADILLRDALQGLGRLNGLLGLSQRGLRLHPFGITDDAALVESLRPVVGVLRLFEALPRLQGHGMRRGQRTALVGAVKHRDGLTGAYHLAFRHIDGFYGARRGETQAHAALLGHRTAVAALTIDLNRAHTRHLHFDRFLGV